MASWMTTSRWLGGSGSDAIRDISGYLESSPLAVLSKRRRRAPFNAAATLPCSRVSPQSSSDTSILVPRREKSRKGERGKDASRYGGE